MGTQSLFGGQKWTRSRRWTTSQNSCLGSWNATLTDIHTGLGSQTQETSSWLLRCKVGQIEMKNHWSPIMNSSGDNYLMQCSAILRSYASFILNENGKLE